MAIEKPDRKKIEEIAEKTGITLTRQEAEAFPAMIGNMLMAYDALDTMKDNLPEVRYSGREFTFPTSEENPFNAWYVRTSIKGNSEGKLKGKRIAIKDSVMVAELPMMNGSSVFEGYIPEFDATVVERLLDAGAEIVGKSHCEYFCFSGGSHTNSKGPVRNPHNPEYSSGGSSSGSAVLVSLGEVDMAIGGDQGGSIRMPSSFSGTYGMKPTYGLVPYTGAIPIDVNIDHLGPITSSVKDNALMLEVIAGKDEYDSRQREVITHGYTENLDAGISGLKVGILKEGFELPSSEKSVSEKVLKAAERLRGLGASVEEVSIPMHFLPLQLPVMIEGSGLTLSSGSGFGVGRSDLFPSSLMKYFHEHRNMLRDAPPMVKLSIIVDHHIKLTEGSHFYGKAINLIRTLRKSYDEVLNRFDLLMMPTTPMKATPLPGAEAPVEQLIQRAIEPMGNTVKFNMTHHPAMSIPCGMVEGLPVGMMLVGKHFDEPTIYRAAYAFEQSVDWKTL